MEKNSITFDDFDLNKSLRNALSDLQLVHPTTIQEKAFPIMMSGRDVLGIAQTGTGKTFAYLLPCLKMWTFTKEKSPSILILVPTRELVAQVVQETEKLAKYSNLVVGGVYGGTSTGNQVLMIRKGLDVLVATPGRLLDFILSGDLKLKNIKRLIIDEVDEMLDLGFRPQLIRVFDFLPAKRQNIMFSATMSESVEVLINDFFNFPIKIEAARTGTPLEKIEQTAYQVPNFNTKINLLKLLLNEHSDMSKVLVFASTKRLSDIVFEAIESSFPDKIGVIHSDKAQNKRFETVMRFHSGEIRILVATDIIARGIDISEVTHVFNLDIPEEPEQYMHRIGRTGRADKKGIAISFMTEKEIEFQTAIEEMMNTKVPVLSNPENLELSDVLMEHEIPKVKMKTIAIKIAKKDESNAAFHAKSAKNSKVNNKIRLKEAMHMKYGKPKTRGMKKKSR